MDRARYLDELEKEHLTIKRLFKEINHAVERKDPRDIGWLAVKVNELKMLLLGHVYREDEMFYKDLQEEAVKLNQEALLPALDVFIKSMADISAEAMEFFDKYGVAEKIRENFDGFVSDFARLSGAIEKRITSEEGSLFHIYRAYYHL